MTDPNRPVLLYLYTRLGPEIGYREVAFPGGAQLCFFRLAAFFNANGYRVIVGSDDPEDSLAVSELADCGIQHFRIPFTNQAISSTLQSIYELIKLILVMRVVLIHSHHRRTTLLSFIIAKLTGAQLIYNAHLAFKDKRYFGRFAGKHIIAVSNGTKQNLVDFFGIEPDRVTVIYNGARIEEPSGTEVEECKRQLGLEQDVRFATFIGRISEQKGLIYLIRALPAVLARHPSFHLLVLGGVHEQVVMDELLSEIQTLGIERAVHFLGHLDRVAPYVHLGEFTLLPSLREGLPGTAIESLLLGRAVAGSTANGIPEVVSHGVDGLLVPPADPVRLAEAINALLDDPEGTRDMGARGRLKAQKTFTMDLMYKAYGDYYRNLLGN